MARLDHPNVVRVYEVGQSEGRTHLSMEYVEGTTLGRWLERGDRSWESIVEAFVTAGQGLTAAHAAGLAHCDFKLRGYYRKQVKRQHELDDFADVCVAESLRSPSSILAHAEEARLLVVALRHLTLAQQIVVELTYFEDLRGPDDLGPEHLGPRGEIEDPAVGRERSRSDVPAGGAHSSIPRPLRALASSFWGI